MTAAFVTGVEQEYNDRAPLPASHGAMRNVADTVIRLKRSLVGPINDL